MSGVRVALCFGGVSFPILTGVLGGKEGGRCVRLVVERSQYASVGLHHSIREAWTMMKVVAQKSALPWRARRLSLLVETGLGGC